MISAPSRLLPSNGNKWFIGLAVLLFLGACSPKIQPVVVQPRQTAPPKPVAKVPEKEAVAKPPAPVVSTISLILPFGLDHLAPGAAYSSTTLKEADIALDYYRGFTLALDSLTAKGYNYKVQVFDSRDQRAQAHSLAYNPAIRTSNLIVGPVFPEDMKAFIVNMPAAKQPIVSPLSPASPLAYKNPQLVTMMPPLEYHAWAAAKYIKQKVNPERVFILRSGFSEENEYLVPFKRAMDSLSKNRVKFTELTVIHGQLNTLLPQLSPTEKNVFIIPATDQHFLTITLRALDTVAKSYPVMVFGHPNWVNYSFLKAPLLQRLDTHITSSDRVDYHAANTEAFARQYHDIYHAEPTSYAIKGFDEGLYFGTLLATDSLKDLGTSSYKGLHNSFDLQRKPGLGWINTHVSVYKYENYELKKVE